VQCAFLGYDVTLGADSRADFVSLHYRNYPRFANNSCAPITHLASCDDVGFVKLQHAHLHRVHDAPTVFVAVVIDTMRPALVPHFVKHYMDLGVRAENFVIVVHMGTRATTNSEQVKTYLIASNIAFVEWWGEFTTGGKIFHLLHALQISRASDFVVWADLDEFHEFDATLRSLDYVSVYNFFVVNGCNTLAGHFIDRVAPNGALAEIQPDVDLQLQFPLRCNVTQQLLNAGVRKTLLTSAALRADGGHHAVPGNRYFELRGMAYLLPNISPAERTSLVCRKRLRTSHFKWTAGTIEYLASRSKSFKERNIPWWKESQRLVDSAAKFGQVLVDKSHCET
jgi:hypothetical protein